MRIVKRSIQLIVLIASCLAVYYCFHEMTREISMEEQMQNAQPMDKLVCIAGIIIFSLISLTQIYSLTRAATRKRRRRKKKLR